MNPTGKVFCGAKNCLLAALLATGCALLTGCPHNEYTVELKPHGNAIERTLTFCRTDSNSNGVPSYQEFPTNELAAITRVYPPGAVQPDGQRFVAHGEFSGALPPDVGGNGHYTNLATSLGSAGFYLERFRGNDDLVGRTTNQFATADKITDLVIGWAQTEFGAERGWKDLRKFLDEDFRHDLKNAGLYLWTGKACALADTNAPEEFAARFAQYLLERGYLRLADMPALYSSDGKPVLLLVQKLTAGKMKIPAGEPLPKSFAVLADAAALETSWSNYLAKTDLYRAKVKDWEQERKTNPKLEQPDPDEVMKELITQYTKDVFDDGEVDQLTVKLALASAPDHSNGHWQDGKVVWDAKLEPNRALPVLCYASWSSPVAEFQNAHFGKVILAGDELTQYCLWQNGLDATTAAAWEIFLAGLSPGDGLKEKLEAFKFNVTDSGRDLLVNALATSPAKNPDSK